MRSLIIRTTYALLLVAAPARAQLVGKVAVSSTKEDPTEVALTLTAQVNVRDVDVLQRCLARRDRRLAREAAPSLVFSKIRWIPSELKVLRECSTGSCKYELPPGAVRRLAAAGSLAEKKRTYLRLVQELSAGAQKTRKADRVRPTDVRQLCASHGAFRWLLEGALAEHCPMSWRRVGGTGRMQRTMMTFQDYTWTVGKSRCAGRILLFADHYYNDHLELLEVTPVREGRATVRYHVRSRFDFLTSWWKRKAFKWRIRSAMKDQNTRLLRRWISGCVTASGASPS